MRGRGGAIGSADDAAIGLGRPAMVRSTVAAIAVIVVGITARITETDTTTARLETHGPIVKAGKPSAITARDGVTIR